MGVEGVKNDSGGENERGMFVDLNQKCLIFRAL